MAGMLGLNIALQRSTQQGDGHGAARMMRDHFEWSARYAEGQTFGKKILNVLCIQALHPSVDMSLVWQYRKCLDHGDELGFKDRGFFID
mmetsp:Transcript_62141/g.133619  ORF Transcript_62141/g.133619 Transcript_62141/m.133619 type:complete len:89 (+) Transcript_62141:178-444(+)